MELRHPKEWRRYGRGLERQFFATDEEVQRYLEQLPPALGPYDLIVVRLAGPRGKARRESLVNTIAGHFANPSSDTFWLRAARLACPVPLDSDITDWCAINGFILIQHGGSREGKRLASRIAIVDKIENLATGEIVDLAEQVSLFKVLDKCIADDLRFTTIQRFRDGHEEEDSVQLMTKGAAQLKAGFFAREPGRPR